MDRSHMTGKILNLTLKIIYLLTGEDYVPIKRSDEDAAPPSYERENDEKILELTNRIIELLTAEGEDVNNDTKISLKEDNIHVLATLTCKEEETPMIISADQSSQASSVDNDQNIPQVDGIECKEEEIATDITSGKLKLNQKHPSNPRPAADASQNIEGFPVGRGVDRLDSMDAHLNIVVIDDGEGDLPCKEEVEEVPIGSSSEGSMDELQKPPRPAYSEESRQKEDEESEDTEMEDELLVKKTVTTSRPTMSVWAKRRLAAEIMVHVAEMEAHEERPRKRKRRIWSKQWLQQEAMSDMGPSPEIRDNNPDDFRNYLGMSEESFSILLASVTPFIEKQNTVMREAISAERRLVVTLRFLATGRSLQDLKVSAAISVPSLSAIIPETCDAIVRSLKAGYLKFPNTMEDWKMVAEDFDGQWQFPNCGGAIDGKHIRISRPSNSGSYYYNYKGYFSIILMALVNANYEFMMVDVGKNGRVSDGGILEHTKFMELLETDRLRLPSNEETKANLNFVFIGDEAFPLQTHLLRPFPQKLLDPERKIFNYRLSRARRVVDNAFGIMTNRFRIFHTAINLLPEKIEKVVLACCVLHNFLRRHDPLTYSPSTMLDSENVDNLQINYGEWRLEAQGIIPLQPLQALHACDDAMRSREQYSAYFNGVGAVSWQDGMI